MRKINVKNIALIIGITAFDLGVGFYDRFVNSTGIIKGILETINAVQIGIPEWSYLPTGQVEASMPTVVMNSGTAFSFGPMLFFIILAFVIIMAVAGMLTSRGGMS
jgi:hypothetical protein